MKTRCFPKVTVSILSILFCVVAAFAQADAQRPDDSLGSFLKQIAGIESALAASGGHFDKLAAQAKAAPTMLAQEPWETDEEFKARFAEDLASRVAAIKTDQDAGEQDLRDSLAAVDAELAGQTFTLSDKAVTVAYGAFDRAKKLWPVTVTSKDPILAYSATLSHDISKAEDMRTAYTEVDSAIKADSFVGEMDFGIARVEGSSSLLVTIKAVRVRDTVADRIVLESSPNAGVYGISARNPDKRITTGTLAITSLPNGAQVKEGQNLLGTTPFRVELKAGNHQLTASWPKSKLQPVPVAAAVLPVSVTQLEIQSYSIGNNGPAGGIIFYDKGQASDGWRYLEAAPNDQSAGIQWSNNDDIDIKTNDSVGAGRANTDAITTAQGSGNYAAALCKNLTLGGFSDWFLPSQGELDLMYKNLKTKSLGGFGESWLWSSSQSYIYEDTHHAWGQRFSDGEDDYHYGQKVDKFAVRACRAF